MTKTKASKAKAAAARSGNKPMPPVSKGTGKKPRRNRNQRLQPGRQDFMPQGNVETKKFVFDEVIGYLDGTTAFALTKFALQPGLPSSFPKGANEAKQWTEWKIKRTSFLYEPTVGQYAPEGQMGEVVLAFDYNAANATPADMESMQILQNSPGMPVDTIQLVVKPKMANKADPKYVRTGPVPLGDDIRLYDGGNLWVATQGFTGNSQCGKLRARYEWELRCPTLTNVGAGGVAPAIAQFATAGYGTLTGGETVVTPAVPQDLQVASAVVNGIAAVNTAGSIVPPAGNYQVTAQAFFEPAAPSMTNAYLEINYGATTLVRAQTESSTYGASLNASWYVQADGVTPFTFPVLAVWSGLGGTLVWGSVSFQAL